MEPGILKRSTLQRHLYDAGFGKKQMKKYTDARASSTKRYCKDRYRLIWLPLLMTIPRSFLLRDFMITRKRLLWKIPTGGRSFSSVLFLRHMSITETIHFNPAGTGFFEAGNPAFTGQTKSGLVETWGRILRSYFCFAGINEIFFSLLFLP